MASTTKQPRASPSCDICTSVRWSQLPSEDANGVLHHKTRRSLEASAEHCTLCAMVLRAAISNYRDSKGVRYGKGHWRTIEHVKYSDGKSVRDVKITRNLGSHVPASNLEVEARAPPLASSLAITLQDDFTKNIGVQVIGHTGNIDDSHASLPSAENLDLSNLEIGSLTENMPVWLYGNIWANSKSKQSGDSSHLRLLGVGARFGTSPSPFDAHGSQPGEMSLRGSSIGICTATEDSDVFPHIPGRLRELESSSDTAFFRIKTWLEECNSKHKFCNQPELNTQLPTRVIDVGSTGQMVTLFEQKGATGRYIALSHSWGSSPLLTTTKNTLDEFKKGIQVSSLPKTFQDAVQITRKLGIRFLWIDSLCIIQDHSQDWERESAKMGSVYRNSYLTISAMASPDSSSGCFPRRNTDSYVTPATRSLGYQTFRETSGTHSKMIEYEVASRPGRRACIHLFDEWLPGSKSHSPQWTRIGAFGKAFDPVADESLSTRGWTLQERLLSPRTVHYASNQMYFECESMLLSEDGFEFPVNYFCLKNILSTQRIPFEMHGIPKDRGVSFIVGKPAEGKGPRWDFGWLGLVENYSRRRLTYPIDKLSALAGIARVTAEGTGDLYLAGVWAGHLPEDLFWRVYPQEESIIQGSSVHSDVPVKGEVLGSVVQPAEYRAPSWSWASIDAPIKYIPLSYSNLVCRVRNCFVSPRGLDDYGTISGGSIDIEGPLYMVKPYRSKRSWRRHGTPITIDLDDERGSWHGEVHLDVPNEQIPSPCYALFLDPANAIIVQSKHLEPSKVGQDTEGPPILVSRNIFCTQDLHESMRKTPDWATVIWINKDQKSMAVQISHDTYRQVLETHGNNSLVNEVNHVTRIGIGTLVRKSEAKTPDVVEEAFDSDKNPPMRWDPAIHGKLDPKSVMQVGGDESWGPITREDAKIPVTIF